MISKAIATSEILLTIFLGTWSILGALTYTYDFLFNKNLIKYETTTYPVEKREMKSKKIKDLREICQVPKRGYGKFSVRLKIYRFFSIYVTRLLISTPVTANHVTVFTILVALISATLFGFGSYLHSIIAALILLSIEIWDSVDGEIARYKGLSSLKGVYIDGVAHTIFTPAIFAGITIGVFITTNKLHFLIFGISAIAFSALIPVLQGTKDSKFLYKLIAFSKGNNLIDLPPKNENSTEKTTHSENILKTLFKRGYNFLKFTFLKYIIALAAIFGFLHFLVVVFGIIYPLLWLLFFIKEANSGTEHLNHLVEPYRPK